MAVNGQFHAFASVPWGKATVCPQSRRLDGLQWCSGCFGEESNFFCSYRNRTPDFSAHRINCVSLFIISFVTDLNLYIYIYIYSNLN